MWFELKDVKEAGCEDHNAEVWLKRLRLPHSLGIFWKNGKNEIDLKIGICWETKKPD